MENIVIGIEGLVGSGKTSICRELLSKIPNSIIFHGGNLYRWIVYAFMVKNRSLETLQNMDITKVMKELDVKIELQNNETVVYIGNKKIEEEKLQNKETSMAVSVVANKASNIEMFIFARNIINNLKEKYNVIVSGRALMEIYPNLDYHFFITASIEERTKRKLKQYNGEVSFEELKEHIAKRDELQEKTGFYKKNSNTITVDVTKCTTALESTNKVCEYIKQTFEKKGEKTNGI